MKSFGIQGPWLRGLLLILPMSIKVWKTEFIELPGVGGPTHPFIVVESCLPAVWGHCQANAKQLGSPQSHVVFILPSQQAALIILSDTEDHQHLHKVSFELRVRYAFPPLPDTLMKGVLFWGILY